MSQEQSLQINQHIISASPGNVHALRDHFSEFLLALGLSDEEKEHWKLCFTEAVNNSIEHGSKSEEDEVKVRWWASDSSLWLEVQDCGNGPSDDQLKQPALPDDPLAEGGRGLFIITDFVDASTSWRGPDGYIVSMRKAYEHLNSVIPEHSEMEAILDELSDSYESLSLFDRMAENLLEDERIDAFVQSGLDLFMDSRDYDQINFEVRDPDSAPEYGWITQIRDHAAFGALKSDCWQQLEENESITWGPNGEPCPFECPNNPCLIGGCVPVYIDEKAVALIAVAYSHQAEDIRSNDIRNLRALADILGISISRALIERERDERKRLEVEVNLATKLQHQLLPIAKEPPEIAGYDLFYRSSSALDVAGDYVEVRKNIDGDYLGCVIDVMGKGVSAAILAGIFRSQFIGYSLRTGSSLGSFLERCNQALEIQLGEATMFITAYIFKLNPRTHEFSYAAAGHPPALWFKQDGTNQQLPSEGPPIGLFENIAYSENTIQLSPKDRVVLVTDGLYEWTDGKTIFGWDEMVAWFRANHEESAENIWKMMNEKMIAARNEIDIEQEDDETLLIVTRDQI